MESNRVVSKARQRVKEAVSAEIVAEARRQLADEGAGALSLRAVARELGMASSAVYRYFPSRDELLTALIVEAYDSLGDVAEVAAGAGGGAFGRWRAVCRAVRDWAIGHPHEYALIYGSPVPGYHAPELTVGPASRVTLILAGLLTDAHRAGELQPTASAPLSRAMSAEARRIGQLAFPGVPLPTVAMGLLVWSQLFGQISFELFGRLDGVVEHPDVLFEFVVTSMAVQLGIHHGRPART
jgi:AcrR family transcriptional regulator